MQVAPPVAPPVPPVSNALLAVLEIRNHQADKELAGYFSDRVRTRSLDAVPGLRVMTRENAQVLLEGKKLEDCEGECDVETGRHIGADLVVSGDLRMIGSNYKLDLRLHDVRSGLLLSGAQAQGKTIDDLDASVAQAVTTLLEPTRHLPPTSGAVRGEPEKPVEAKPRPAPPPEAWLAPAPLPDLPKEAPLLAERPAVKLAPAPPPTAPAAATEPAGQTAPAPAAERSRTWTWVAGGAAMAALGAGGAFGLKSRSTSAAITGTTDHTGRDVDSLRDQYQSQAHAANVLFAVGAGFAALSAGFFILSF